MEHPQKGGPEDHAEAGHDHTGHDHDHSHERSGGSFGWLWIVGIILVVALVLYALQRNVPTGDQAPVNDAVDVTDDVSAPTVANAPAGVYNVQAPLRASSNAIIGLSWDVATPEASTITETYIEWGTVTGSYAEKTTDYLSGTFSVPARFDGNIRVPEGADDLYGRAVAVIDGVTYTSEEFTIDIAE